LKEGKNKRTTHRLKRKMTY